MPMFHCTKCKATYRKLPRKCPKCGGHCVYMPNHNTVLIIAIAVLAVILAGLLIYSFTLSNPNDNPNPPASSSSIPGSSSASVPSSSATQPTPPTTIPTQPSSAPTQPSTVPTTPTVPPTTGPSVGIGMYTMEELEAMDKTYNPNGFGAGRAPNHQRPSYVVSEQAKYEQYGGLFIGPDDKNVYLTFDCGYEYYAKDENGKEYAVTAKILDVLKEKNAKAVFFITMDYVNMSPDLVRRMIDEGHVVGNHTVYHPVMPSKSIDRMQREVMNLHNHILENYGYKMTLFRPPTGAYSIQSLAVVQNLGYKSVLWSFQYADYFTDNQPSTSSAFKLITENSHNGCIFLLHAVSETNAAVLGDVIDNLRNDQGYTIGLLS